MKLLIPFLLILSSCTYTIIMAHTEGQTSDLVDDTSSANPNISPTLNLPVE